MTKLYLYITHGSKIKIKLILKELQTLELKELGCCFVIAYFDNKTGVISVENLENLALHYPEGTPPCGIDTTENFFQWIDQLKQQPDLGG